MNIKLYSSQKLDTNSSFFAFSPRTLLTRLEEKLPEKSQVRRYRRSWTVWNGFSASAIWSKAAKVQHSLLVRQKVLLFSLVRTICVTCYLSVNWPLALYLPHYHLIPSASCVACCRMHIGIVSGINRGFIHVPSSACNSSRCFPIVNEDGLPEGVDCFALLVVVVAPFKASLTISDIVKAWVLLNS